MLQWYGGGLISEVPVLRPVGQLHELAASVRGAIDPVATILAAVRQRIQPAPLAGVDGLPPAALRAQPTFARSGLEHLVGLGVDYLCPGLDDVGDNAVSVLETNQAAVESFLIGLNDELASELLWREYPAVLTDTWITRFWSPSGLGGNDIEPIADWTTTRRLGAAAGDADAVVFIRGDLLVHYPTALVYLLPGIVTGSRRLSRPTTSIRSRPASWPRSAGAPASMAFRSTSNCCAPNPAGSTAATSWSSKNRPAILASASTTPHRTSSTSTHRTSRVGTISVGAISPPIKGHSTASLTPGSRAGASPG